MAKKQIQLFLDESYLFSSCDEIADYMKLSNQEDWGNCPMSERLQLVELEEQDDGLCIVRNLEGKEIHRF